MSSNRSQTSSAASKAAEPSPIVYIIDDDADVREALESLLQSVGLESKSFSSTQDFLRNRSDIVSCLILDVRLFGTSGLDFQLKLTQAGIDIPVIFITGHGDMHMSVGAMKAGAVHFLTKPFREQDLLDAVQEALARDRTRRTKAAQWQGLKARYESLSEREREVFPLITAGLQNKQIAHKMQLAEVTAKVHRGSLMRKLQARGVADLVKIAGVLGIA